MNEQWKYIKNYDGIYQISNMGNVKNVKKNNLLKFNINKSGRYYVDLFKNGKRKKYLVYRLVAQAFIPNPENKPEINHIDGNKQNNCIDNLEWCTASENQKHAYKNKLNRSKMKPIIRSDGKIYQNTYIASKELNVSPCSIRDVLKGRIKTCKGFKFNYIKNS